MQKNRKQIPDARVFRIKGTLPNGHVSTRFSPRLGVSAVKLFIDLSKSARNKRAKRPASDEVSADHFSDKYQSTRNSQLSAFGLTFQTCKVFKDRIYACAPGKKQLSAFGLTFQICEMCEEDRGEVGLCEGSGELDRKTAVSGGLSARPAITIQSIGMSRSGFNFRIPD